MYLYLYKCDECVCVWLPALVCRVHETTDECWKLRRPVKVWTFKTKQRINKIHDKFQRVSRVALHVDNRTYYYVQVPCIYMYIFACSFCFVASQTLWLRFIHRFCFCCYCCCYCCHLKYPSIAVATWLKNTKLWMRLWWEKKTRLQSLYELVNAKQILRECVFWIFKLFTKIWRTQTLCCAWNFVFG